MPTIAITHEIDIDRPAAEVWALLADYGNDPTWRRGVTTMAPNPPGPVPPGWTGSAPAAPPSGAGGVDATTVGLVLGTVALVLVVVVVGLVVARRRTPVT